MLGNKLSKVRWSLLSVSSFFFFAVVGVPDVSNLRTVLQVPAVGHFVLPANISRVLPQQANLVVGVSRVPQ